MNVPTPNSRTVNETTGMTLRGLNNAALSLFLPQHPDHWRMLANVSRSLYRSGQFGCLDDNGNLEPYPFATPLFLSPDSRSEVSGRARAVLDGIQDIGRRLAAGEHLLPGLDPYTKSITRKRFPFDHGYSLHAPIVRLDMALTAEGPQVLEINSGCPGGELDGGLLGRTFLDEAQSFAGSRSCSSERKGAEATVRFYDPREESLRAVMRAYEEFRSRVRPDFPREPNAAVVTGGPQRAVLLPEARGIAEYYRIHSVPAWAGDLEDLRMERGRLFLGPNHIHLVYRKFATLSFFKRLDHNDSHPFLPEVYKGYTAHRFCMVNPLSSTLLQDKGILAALWSGYPHLREIIPETHLLEPGILHERPYLLHHARAGEEFILKRRISFAGKWVILDPEQVRQRLPVLLEEEPGRWIMQRRVEEPEGDFSVVRNSVVRPGRYRFNMACFGESFFVRVSLGGEYDPINAGTGGAETCLFSVEGADGRVKALPGKPFFGKKGFPAPFPQNL